MTRKCDFSMMYQHVSCPTLLKFSGSLQHVHNHLLRINDMRLRLGISVHSNSISFQCNKTEAYRMIYGMKHIILYFIPKCEDVKNYIINFHIFHVILYISISCISIFLVFIYFHISCSSMLDILYFHTIRVIHLRNN